MTAATGLFLYVLATYGFGTTVAVLKIGDVLIRRPLAWLAARMCVFKPLAALVCCPPCLALWGGLGLSIKGFSPARMVWPSAPWMFAIVDAFGAAGATWLLHVLAEKVSKGLDL